MKSVRLSFNRKKFDDQYTFDLQNNLTIHDFQLIVGVFNQAAQMKRPPGPKSLWVVTLITMWMTIATSLYLFWGPLDDLSTLIALATSLIMSLLFLVCLYRNRRIKFEENILEICGRLNATENIRGINFRFIKNNVDVTKDKLRSLSGVKATYALDIEFDDRFNALKSSRFNQRSTSEDGYGYIPPPKSAYINQNVSDEKDSSCMFQDPPPAWIPPYNDKNVFQYA